ncbi:MAG: hypothetical protein OEX07_11245 [Gammaproteobacteria bacterium]|nr:hypothetical protein [Gammaproteobacteria bacterium]
MTTLSIQTEHQLYYNNKNPIPIPELIGSLAGIEALIKRTPGMLQELMPGIKIQDINVYVSELHSGSLIEDLIIDLVFCGQEEYDAFREALRKLRKGGFGNMTGDDKKAMKPLFGLLLAGLIGAGAVYVAKSNNEPTTHIEAYNNTIINFGAGEFDIKSDQFKAIIETAVGGNKKKLVKEVVSVIKPAKLDPEASLQIDGNKALTIDSKVIESVPFEYEEPKQLEKSKDHNNVDLMIFASDQDKTGQGWAGTLPGLVENRTKVTLDKTLDPKKLHGKLKLKADVTVYSRFNKAKNAYEIKEIFVRATN